MYMGQDFTRAHIRQAYQLGTDKPSLRPASILLRFASSSALSRVLFCVLTPPTLGTLRMHPEPVRARLFTAASMASGVKMDSDRMLSLLCFLLAEHHTSIACNGLNLLEGWVWQTRSAWMCSVKGNRGTCCWQSRCRPQSAPLLRPPHLRLTPAAASRAPAAPAASAARPAASHPSSRSCSENANLLSTQCHQGISF